MNKLSKLLIPLTFTTTLLTFNPYKSKAQETEFGLGAGIEFMSDQDLSELTGPLYGAIGTVNSDISENLYIGGIAKVLAGEKSADNAKVNSVYFDISGNLGLKTKDIKIWSGLGARLGKIMISEKNYSDTDLSINCFGQTFGAEINLGENLGLLGTYFIPYNGEENVGSLGIGLKYNF